MKRCIPREPRVERELDGAWRLSNVEARLSRQRTAKPIDEEHVSWQSRPTGSCAVCGGPTSFGKPYCVAHIRSMPYVSTVDVRAFRREAGRGPRAIAEKIEERRAVAALLSEVGL